MMSVMPFIVGRENLLQARSVSMVSVRLATVISPALGGILIAGFGDQSSYWVSTIGTLVTVLLLISLPAMKPQGACETETSPFQQMAEGVKFLFRHKIVGSTVLIGTVLTFSSAIRITFPALIQEVFHGSAFQLGLLYSAVPLGATAAALFSGWVSDLTAPGRTMILACIGTFICFIAVGLLPFYWICLPILVVFGYLMSLANLLQYTIVQGYTPDDYLGRINAIWLAQDASGDTVATAALGVLSKLTAVNTGIVYFGLISLCIGLLFYFKLEQLHNAKLSDPELNTQN